MPKYPLFLANIGLFWKYMCYVALFFIVQAVYLYQIAPYNGIQEIMFITLSVIFVIDKRLINAIIFGYFRYILERFVFCSTIIHNYGC